MAIDPATNPTVQTLHTRKSVRKFTEEPVEPTVRDAILCAAFAAPSAGNQQMYTIIEVTDQALKEHLARTCDDQPFIAEAPLVLVFCADYQKWYDGYVAAGVDARPPAEGDFLLAVLDTAIAAHAAVTAAEALGLGTCYIGDILENIEDVKPVLRLPDLVTPLLLVVIGHPTAQAAARHKPERVAAEHIVHENTYRRLDADQLRGMWAHRTGRHTFEEWMTTFAHRKYQSAFSREMSRTTRAYLDAFLSATSSQLPERATHPPLPERAERVEG